MMLLKSVLSALLFVLFFHPSLLASDTKERGSWSGISARAGFGSIFDFELDKRKGDDYPAEALFKYGVEYGYQFKNTGLYIAAALDWTIVYPRNFDSHGKKLDFLKPPVSLWYVPLSNLQLGWAFNESWLATVGLIYYWGASTSLRYRFTKSVFVETRSVIWMDRIFNTGGFYGGGLDNLHLTVGMGYKW